MYNRHMKQLSFAFIIGLSLLVPAYSHAQAPAQQVPETNLLDRRTAIAGELRVLHAKLIDLRDRTSIALARLEQNNVDVAQSRASLTRASEKLTTAETAITTFTSIALPRTTTTAPKNLRDALESSETNLRDARSAIIESLLKVRTTISPEAAN